MTFVKHIVNTYYLQKYKCWTFEENIQIFIFEEEFGQKKENFFIFSNFCKIYKKFSRYQKHIL